MEAHAAKGIGIILRCFTNSFTIYSVVPFYYCIDHPPNTISLGAIKFYDGFQQVTYKLLEHCDFVDP